MKQFKKEDRRGEIIKRISGLREAVQNQSCYLPTNPEYHIKDILVDSAAAMQSAGKAPYRLMFVVERWDGPDSALRLLEQKTGVKRVAMGDGLNSSI